MRLEKSCYYFEMCSGLWIFEQKADGWKEDKVTFLEGHEKALKKGFLSFSQNGWDFSWRAKRAFWRFTYIIKHVAKGLENTLGQNPTFYPKIPWNLMFEKCEFCKKWDFENVNFVKNETLKLRILGKVRFSKCEFLDKLRIFAPLWRDF